jgi:hypothetical protein
MMPLPETVQFERPPTRLDPSLRERLDDIDQKLATEVFTDFYESRLKIECSVWEKGKTVVENLSNRGVNPRNPPRGTFEGLKNETGRGATDLKRWCELYERYPRFEVFLEKYGKPKAEAWTRKALGAAKQALPSRVLSLPSGPFDIFYADPPWEYDFSRSHERLLPVPHHK